jgi:hypothetical protein
MAHTGGFYKQTKKNINMKQLLFLFLFLLPCLAWAQYPSNGNQKITLGEQTTADGLIYRGVASTDTVRKPSIDTMAYMVLDTTTNIMWHYKKATNNAWLRLNLLPSDTASMLTNYYRSGRTGIIQASDVPTLNQNTTGSAATLTTSRTFQTNLASTSTASFNGSANVTPGVTGTLPVANGGTGATTFTSGRILFGNSTTNINSSSNLFWDNTNNRMGIGTSSPGATLTIIGNARFQGYDADYYNANFMALGDATRRPKITLASNGGYRWSAYVKDPTGDGEYVVRYEEGSLDALVIDRNGITKIDNLSGSGSRGVNAASDGTLSAASSILIKENVENINYGLSDVLKLKPVIFNYIDRNKWGEGKDLGFVAEDVMNVIPEATGVMNNSDIYFDLQKLIPVLTKAIQEQQALIKALEQRIINLENK